MLHLRQAARQQPPPSRLQAAVRALERATDVGPTIAVPSARLCRSLVLVSQVNRARIRLETAVRSPPTTHKQTTREVRALEHDFPIGYPTTSAVPAHRQTDGPAPPSGGSARTRRAQDSGWPPNDGAKPEVVDGEMLTRDLQPGPPS